MKQHGLSSGELAATGEAMLRLPADEPRTLNIRRAWMETAEQNGVLPVTMWHSYLKSLIRVQFKARPVIRIGDPIPFTVRLYSIGSNDDRFLNSVEGYTVYLSSPDGIECDGRVFNRQFHVLFNRRMNLSVTPTPADVASLRAGPATVRAKVVLEMHRIARGDMFSWTEDIESNVSFVAGSESPIRLIHDASKSNAIQKAFHFNPLQGTRNGNMIIWQFGCGCDNFDLPYNVYADCYVRYGAKELAVGHLCAPMGGFGHGASWQFTTDLAERPPMTVDITLRPNPVWANNTVDVDTIWGDDVKIKHLDAVLEPATK
jgi:hypothetical protein